MSLDVNLYPLSIKASSSDKLKKIAKLEKKLKHYAGKAIADYDMIQKRDRVLVCVSGGKDSLTMLLLLNELRKRARDAFELFAFTLDQAQPGWCDDKLQDFFKSHRISYEILKKDTYSIVKEKTRPNDIYCGLCSRLRRGIIYNYAKQHGFNKIALGHHRDDLIHSLLMSLFYNGKVRSMPPKLLSDNQQHIIIRPLVYCQEKDIAAFAELNAFPIIPCNLCGSQENLTRKKVSRWVGALAAENPKIPSNLLRALQNVAPSQLMDKNLWNFKELEEKRMKEGNEDGKRSSFS